MDELLGRQTPHSATAEQAVIGSILIDSRCVRKVVTELQSDDFYFQNNRDIFDTVYSMFGEGKAIDPVTILEEMRNNEKIGEETEKYMADVMRMTPTASNVMEYAAIVKERGALRRMKDQAWDVIQNCDSGPEMAAELMKISRNQVQGKTRKLRGMADLMQETADKLFDNKKEKRLDTGFWRLDSLLMGLRPGNLTIIGARPGVGKSAFAQNIAQNVAKGNKPVVIYSLEMSDMELAERWVSRTSGVVMDDLIQKQFEKAQVIKLTDSMSYLSTLPIYVCDESNVSPERVRTDMINMDGVELIIVDYVGLMEADGKKKGGFENRNLELGAISRELKKLAVELKIPILMLCQLNRETDSKTRPELRNLRDSGELEQNANKIIFLWNLDEDSSTVGVSVAKNRQGKTGVVQMVFDREHMHFYERDQDIEVPDNRGRSGGKRWGGDD